MLCIINIEKWGINTSEAHSINETYKYIEETGMLAYYNTRTHAMVISRIEKWRSGFFNIPYYKVYTSSSGPVNAGAYVYQVERPWNILLVKSIILP